jgi:hypothetical protein
LVIPEGPKRRFNENKDEKTESEAVETIRQTFIRWCGRRWRETNTSQQEPVTTGVFPSRFLFFMALFDWSSSTKPAVFIS